MSIAIEQAESLHKSLIDSQLLDEEYQKFYMVENPYKIALTSELTPLEGFQRLIMLDRYSYRDSKLETLKAGDTVVVVVKDDPDFPTKGYGKIINFKNNQAIIKLDYPEDAGIIEVPKLKVVKPLEMYWEQISLRVAKAIADVEVTTEKKGYWLTKFYWMLKNFLAIPGGRICYGAGSDLDVTLFNCFVLPFMKDSRKGIMEHISYATEIMSRGGGVGSNISTLRPADALVSGVNGVSSGSVSWANYLSLLTGLIIQGGSRRGAQMIGEADWHPDIIEFILCKIQNHFLLDKLSKEGNDPLIRSKAEHFLVRDDDGNPIGVRDKKYMSGANISVLVSDDFMEAVNNKEMWTLRFPDVENLTPEQKEFYNNEWHNMGDVRKWEELGLPVKVYHSIDANELWNLINTAATYSAEPGIIFIDRYQKEANSWYYSPIIITNPCGEQGLPAFGVCNLIAINLHKMYDKMNNSVNWELLKEVCIVSQRFADNVIDASYYFLPENEKMAKNERRVGKGEMGLADLMIELKLPYGSKEMLKLTEKISKFIAVESYIASADIASEKGSFNLFEADKLLQSGFMRRMPKKVHQAIQKKGLRNVCSLTVAPTGSTGTMVGVAQGLESYYAFEFYRNGQLGKNIKMFIPIAQKYFNENPNATELPEYYVSSMMLTPDQHVMVQASIQKWVDSSISKTANAPSGFTVKQTKRLYEKAYKKGCKGITIYVDGSRETQVLSLTESNGKNAMKEVEKEDNTVNDTRLCKFRNENGNIIKECS
jgi:ribonucleoside-diphosphate reductase alpha chain